MPRKAFALGVGLTLFRLAAALKPFVREAERDAVHFGGFAVAAARRLPATRGTESAAAFRLATGEDAIYDRGVRLAALDRAAIGAGWRDRILAPRGRLLDPGDEDRRAR